MANNIFSKILFGLLLLVFSQGVSQNVSINATATAPVPSAVLDLNDNITGGFLLPYMNTTTRNAIALPLSGTNSLLLYNSDDNCVEGYFSRVGAAVPCNCWQSLYCPCSGSPTTPSITGTNSLCGNAAATYSINTTPPYVGSTSYTWTISGAGGTFYNSTSTITGPAVSQAITWGSPASTTTYTVSITGTNSCGTSTTGTYTVAVNAVTAISGQPSTTVQNLCVGGGATALSVTATGGGLTYQWYSNTANSTSGGGVVNLGAANGGQTATYTPQTGSAGTLYYFCIVNGTCGSAVTSNVSGAVNVYAYPAAVTVTPALTPACTSTTVSASGGNGTFYWQGTTVNGTSTGTVGSPQTANTAGTNNYYYGCEGNATAGCWTWGHASVTINTTPTISAGPTPATQSVGTGVAGSAISITAAGSPGPTYQWYSCNSGGTGQTSLGAANGAQTATYTPPANGTAGTYYFNCIVTSGSPCGTTTSSVATETVSACTSATPSGFTTTFTPASANNGSTLTGCTAVGQTVQYSVASIAGATYTWTITGGTQVSGGTTNTITVTWTTAGTENISVTESNGGCSVSAPYSNNVTVAATCSKTYNTGNTNNTFVIPTGIGTVTLTVSGAVGGAGYSYIGVSNYNEPGGNGATVVGTFTVATTGNTLTAYVGAQGTAGNANSGGGGGGSDGGSLSGGSGGGNNNYGGGGGGGGASGVYDQTTAAWCVVAGGGGGGGDYSSANNQDNGGPGGAATSAAGAGYRGGIQGASNTGSGGTNAAGGTGCSTGGVGTGGNGCGGSTTGNGGGGGGGIYGGGGANYGGGGGGANATYAGFTQTSNTVGANSSVGSITIAW